MHHRRLREVVRLSGSGERHVASKLLSVRIYAAGHVVFRLCCCLASSSLNLYHRFDDWLARASQRGEEAQFEPELHEVCDIAAVAIPGYALLPAIVRRGYSEECGRRGEAGGKCSVEKNVLGGGGNVDLVFKLTRYVRLSRLGA